MTQITNIAENIHYVGVNDRNKHLFEALWPIPQGVSYNSYLIDDEKVVLIDTVDVCYFDLFLDKIRHIIGERPIDYLVVNHMEPDHSGSIRLIKQHYPNLIVVGNKQTAGMLQGYYGELGELNIIDETSSIQTGKHLLKFYLTPMIHWPETMMTFEETQGVLFSGDAFGCYGALNGGILDTEINYSEYFREMIRYYANIVGKYGSPVQRAFRKLNGLDIKVICSTHGPVWTAAIPEVLAIYNKLSKYEAEEGVVVAYGSMYGHTEEMAEVITQELSRQGIKKVVMHNLSQSHISYVLQDVFTYQGLIIGSPTYNGHVFPPVDTLLTALESRNIENKLFASFGSFTWAGAAVKGINNFAERNRYQVVASSVEMKQAMSKDIRSKCQTLAQEMAFALKENRK